MQFDIASLLNPICTMSGNMKEVQFLVIRPQKACLLLLGHMILYIMNSLLVHLFYNPTFAI